MPNSSARQETNEENVPIREEAAWPNPFLGLRGRLWRYRWELLPLLVAIGLGLLWQWLYPLFFTTSPFGPAPVLRWPGADPVRDLLTAFRQFALVNNLVTAGVLGGGMVWAIRTGQVMAAGLWAIVLVRPLGMLFHEFVRYPFVLPEVNSLLLGHVYNLLLQLPFLMLIAVFAWRLGKMGRRHVLLIVAGYLAWGYMSFSLALMSLPPFSENAPVTNWVYVGLWLAKVAGLAFAFHHFPRWDRETQVRAVAWLAGLFLLSVVTSIILFVAGDFGRRLPRLFDWRTGRLLTMVALPLINAGIATGLAWLLVRWRPVTGKMSRITGESAHKHE